jgi:hypothetical protein
MLSCLHEFIRVPTRRKGWCFCLHKLCPPRPARPPAPFRASVRPSPRVCRPPRPARPPASRVRPPAPRVALVTTPTLGGLALPVKQCTLYIQISLSTFIESHLHQCPQARPSRIPHSHDESDILFNVFKKTKMTAEALSLQDSKKPQI